MADSEPAPTGRQPIPPAKRRRLQQMFQHGSGSSTKGDYKYAVEMFTQCVVGDPANLLYLANFLGSLKQQYNNNKKGSKLAGIKGATTKASIKKSAMQKDWDGVFKSGVEMLKLNPWDTFTLTAMAEACGHLDYDECQLAYLKQALEADLKNPEVNRAAARALGQQAKYDEAIMCWNRVQQAKPQDEEARRAIGNLAVEKTIDKGGYEDAESTKDVRSEQGSLEDRMGESVQRMTPEQQLRRQIKKDPANTSLYLQLADMLSAKEEFKEAEEVLNQALEASGGDLNIRERLEDAQLRRQRSQLDIARKQATDQKTAETVEMYKKMQAELNNLEIQVYASRAERYPSNLSLKYQLGTRLMKASKFNDAIKCLQEARTDPQNKGAVHLTLGECFQHIKQFKLAMSNYEQALTSIPEREKDQMNLALYRAGKLSLGLKELDVAEKHLTELAGRDFGYKDVAECLDKIRKLRDNA